MPGQSRFSLIAACGCRSYLYSFHAAASECKGCSESRTLWHSDIIFYRVRGAHKPRVVKVSELRAALTTHYLPRYLGLKAMKVLPSSPLLQEAVSSIMSRQVGARSYLSQHPGGELCHVWCHPARVWAQSRCKVAVNIGVSSGVVLCWCCLFKKLYKYRISLAHCLWFVDLCALKLFLFLKI